jgi:putative transposase
MPRIARIVGVGYPHHIVQRGNNRENVFLDLKDYEKYLSFLSRYSEEKDAAILAYCLMPNHVHLLVIPSTEKTLAKMMQGVTLCYTQHLNRKHERTGRLWECRYHSTIVDEESYLWAVSKYIENNPVRAGIVKKPEDYPYSSAGAHILGRKDPILNGTLFDKNELKEYRKFVKLEEDKKTLEEIRKQTRMGKPLGEPDFLRTLSESVGRNLSFKPKGRPKKPGMERRENKVIGG